MAPLGLAHMLSTQEIIKCQLFIFKIDYKAGLLLTPMLVYQSNFFVPSTVPLPSVLGQFFPPPFFFFPSNHLCVFSAYFFSSPPSPGHSAQHVGSQFPKQGLNPGPLQWKHGVLIAGPPGKSSVLGLLNHLGLTYSLKPCICSVTKFY